jgi:hypothetical protein
MNGALIARLPNIMFGSSSLAVMILAIRGAGILPTVRDSRDSSEGFDRPKPRDGRGHRLRISDTFAPIILIISFSVQ